MADFSIFSQTQSTNMRTADKDAAAKPVKVGVMGATGYTGCEALRLLGTHPATKLYAIAASSSSAGKEVAGIWPHLSAHDWPKLVEADDASFSGCDVVFMATPDGVAMKLAPPLLDAGVRVIDLSADFRLRDEKISSQWYGDTPSASQGLREEAVYGLPELFAQEISGARLIANPGCYPTAAILALAPLLRDALISPDSIIIDAKSGTSGAGRRKAPPHAEASDSMHAYAASGHRHAPEMAQALADYSGQRDLGLVFVPHLAPMRRGILASMYLKPLGGTNAETARQSLEQAYSRSPFVQVAPAGECPATATVRGSNMCRISVHQQGQEAGAIVVMSVIDNLVKGAAGQAIQNMNLMFKLPESAGLETSGLVP